jgi:hypothetical protein
MAQKVGSKLSADTVAALSIARGSTPDEITVLITVGRPIDVNDRVGESPPPAGSYCDLGLPPDSGTSGCSSSGTTHDNYYVRLFRSFSRFFNDRFQTYGRNVHHFVYFAAATSAEARRAQAADNYNKLHPFAVIDWIDPNTAGGFRDVYADAMAAKGVLAFFTLDRAPASLYRKFPAQIWSFQPDIEHWAEGYVGYVCARVAPYAVSHATGGVGADGRPMNGRGRRYATWYSVNAAEPGFRMFADLVRERLKRCGVVPVVDVPYNGTGDYDSASRVAAMRQHDVTTILMLGRYNGNDTNAMDAARYYPEIVMAGDGSNDPTRDPGANERRTDADSNSRP